MLRRLALIALVGCSSSSAAVLVTKLDADAGAGVDAGSGSSSSSSGDPGDEQGVADEPLPECIATSIGIWDDFEGPSDGSELVSVQGGQIAFDPLHHCGAQGLKITGGPGSTEQTSFFNRTVPAIPTATKAASWSFLVNFAAVPTEEVAFAGLTLASNTVLSFEYEAGKLSLVEKDAADRKEVHANLATLPRNAWVRIDMRIDYATKLATLKIGEPGGTAPTQELPLVYELGAVTRETLGPNFKATVHFDRAAVYVE